MTDAELDLLADLIAERLLTRLSAPNGGEHALIDAVEVARRYGVSRA